MVTPSLVMSGAPYFFAEHNVAALGAEGDLYGIGELVNAGLQLLAGVFAVIQSFLP